MASGKAHTSFIMCHLASEGDVPFIFRRAKEKTRVTMPWYVLVSTCIIFFPFDSFHLSHIIFFLFWVFLCVPPKSVHRYVAFVIYVGRTMWLWCCCCWQYLHLPFLFLNCQSIQNLFDNTPASLLIMCQMSLVWSKRLHRSESDYSFDCKVSTVIQV